MRRLTAEGHTRVEWQYLDATLHTDLGDLLTLNGATIDAINEYRAAIAMFASLTTTRPSDKRGSRGQQQVLEKLAGVLVTGGQLASAQHEYRTALELASARVRATPDDLEAQVDMVAPEHAIGDALMQRVMRRAHSPRTVQRARGSRRWPSRRRRTCPW